MYFGREHAILISRVCSVLIFFFLFLPFFAPRRLFFRLNGVWTCARDLYVHVLHADRSARMVVISCRSSDEITVIIYRIIDRGLVKSVNYFDICHVTFGKLRALKIDIISIFHRNKKGRFLG